MAEREPISADDVCPVCGALSGEQAKYMGIGPADDVLLRKLADDAFVVMNWARTQGMKKDAQIKQAVAAFKMTLENLDPLAQAYKARDGISETDATNLAGAVRDMLDHL